MLSSTIEPGLMINACSVGSKSSVVLAPERTLSKLGSLGALYVMLLTIKAKRFSTVKLKCKSNTWSAGPEPVRPGLSRGTVPNKGSASAFGLGLGLRKGIFTYQNLARAAECHLEMAGLKVDRHLPRLHSGEPQR
jgi:hypothetical protein